MIHALVLAPIVALALALVAAPCLAEPAADGELLVMNDGLKPVTALRARRAGADAAWSDDLLAGEPIGVREGRRLDLTGLGLGCHVELEVRVDGRAEAVLGEQDVCAADPRFWMAFALGLDEPGQGYAVRADEGGDPAPRRRARVGAVRGADLDRGLPVCPGDPRCKKK